MSKLSNPSNKYGVLSVAQYYNRLGLTKIFKFLSIYLSKFPSAFKLAKVKPIFKKGLKTNVSNCRPNSLPPILLKVIEKVVHEQTTKFLNDNNTFCKYQSGFRNNHSTDLFLSFLNDKIVKDFDNGVFTGIILIDLKKHLIR